MKKNKIIFYTLVSIFFSNPTFAASLDEIYRDIVRDDNSGYLPIFVKNRTRPELLFEEELPKAKTNLQTTQTPVVTLTNEYKIKADAKKAEEENWKNALKAIQANQVTPKDLKVIDEQIAKNNPQAIEIKAWMYARGQGIKQDLISSFVLYRKAEKLGVKDALKNAAQVYKSMSREQRESLAQVKE